MSIVTKKRNISYMIALTLDVSLAGCEAIEAHVVFLGPAVVGAALVFFSSGTLLALGLLSNFSES